MAHFLPVSFVSFEYITHPLALLPLPVKQNKNNQIRIKKEHIILENVANF